MSRSNCTMPVKKIAGFTAYFFAYNAMPDMRFKFSMLCEVGQPWIPTFERMIAERGLDLVTHHIEERPWVITIERKHAPKDERCVETGKLVVKEVA